MGYEIAWKVTRNTIDLAAVATALLGPAPGRHGDRGPRLWWRCPFHNDCNPSLSVEPGKLWWRCYGCGAKGDVASLTMRIKGCSFPEAVRYLTGGPTPKVKKSGTPRVLTVSDLDQGRPSPRPELSSEAALALVTDATARLWSPDGTGALTYLRGRGLTDATIRTARLGLIVQSRPGVPAGITIPWLADGKLTLVNVRRPAGSKPRYQAIKGSRRGGLYPGGHVIKPGMPLIIVEGELDRMA